MKHRSISALVLACLFITSPTVAIADPIEWQSTREGAVEQALNSGKLILLLAGRETCGNCQYMKSTVLETTNVRQVIDNNYICWFCPVDSSTEWYAYASGLGSFTLPLMCVIDPGAPTSYLDRTTSIQSAPEFESRLLDRLPTIPIEVSIQAGSGLLTLEWSSESQLNYRVLKSTDLVFWDFEGSIIAGSGTKVEVQYNLNESHAFYRIMGFR